jgi:hypothetical protein
MYKRFTHGLPKDVKSKIDRKRCAEWFQWQQTKEGKIYNFLDALKLQHAKGTLVGSPTKWPSTVYHDARGIPHDQ